MTYSASLPNLETEITLLVVSDDPERFRSSFIAIDCIGSHALGSSESLIIEDVYLDSTFGELAKHAWVLRVRTENGNAYLTLKGPGKRTAWGGAQRVEIEESWSQESVRRILDIVTEICLDLGPLAVTIENVPPVETLKNCGFVEIHRRQTRRDRRMVLVHGERQPVAELVLDRVLYRLDSQEIRHMEIEIESKDPARLEHTRAVADGLCEAFGQTVRPWDYGKLHTGKILELLLRDNALDGLIRPDNYLVPIVYALIESRMKKR